MINISVLYFVCYGRRLHTDKPNPHTCHIFNLTLTSCTGQTVQKQLAHKPVNPLNPELNPIC